MLSQRGGVVLVEERGEGGVMERDTEPRKVSAGVNVI